jgi:DNA-binding GntR family transcriptional regulator
MARRACRPAEAHAAILEAMRAGDAEQARRAMHDHIEQTRDDLRGYVLKTEPSGQGA